MAAIFIRLSQDLFVGVTLLAEDVVIGIEKPYFVSVLNLNRDLSRKRQYRCIEAVVAQ